MGKYLVTKQAAVFLLLAFLLTATLVGLMCGLLPKCEDVTEFVPTPSPVKKQWEFTRLPETIRPISYDLMVRTDLTNSHFTGSVGVLVECLEATDLILIHSKDLVITEGKTTLTRQGNGADAPKLAKDTWLYAINQFAVIELNGKLEKGARYRLYLEFEGPLKNDLLGYYKMSYKTASGEEKYLASTFFDPVDARKAFPCFDEPALKATFTITLEHEPQYEAIANMPKTGPDTTLGDGWIRATFDESVVMPTYLVCYVVSEFEARFKDTTNGVKFGVWAQEDFIDQVDYALEKGAAILDFFDDLYGEKNKYPLPKMDMIALPDFTAGAMENWGLITYRESALLYKDGVSSESQKQRVCTIIAHELAHQWFGNLVTMKWWDHLWLNEGFASYVEYVGTVAVEPDWRMWDKFILYDLHRAMATDALVTSRPIITEVLTPSEINSMFDRISYQKGSSVLRMMNHFLGESTFTKGLKYYVEALQYGSAENSDLWFHLDKAIQKDNIDLGGLNLATIMDTWTLQMGFPFIKVERTYNGARQITARVEQQRFLSDPDSDPSTDHPDLGYKWYVPVTYTTASSPDFDSPRSMWLKPQDEFGTLQLSGGSDDDWLLVNINQRGMYRVNYDDKNWQLIKMQLESVHTVIPTASRAALISDVFSLAMAREISHRTALDITSYLKEERDYVPWYAVDSALGHIERNIRRKGAFGNFQKYMREQITPMYEYTGWKNEGDHLKSLSRGRAINMACRYRNEDCVQTSVNLYAQWMNNIGQNLIPGIHPDMQATAFCTAIAEGDQNEWYFAFERYQNPNTSTSVKSALLTAMACSKKPWILSTYLKSSLDSSIIRSQDREDVVTAVAGNPVGLPLAWDFFRANWDFFREEYGDTVFLLDSLISGITSNFNTEFELQMLKQFMEDHPDQGTGARAFAEAVAVIEANIRWVEQFYDEVEGWLTETVNTPKVWEEIRLPLSLIPEHYDLTIRTDLTEFVFNGTVDILFECKEKTSIVLLHSKSLNFTEGVTEITRINDGPTPTRTKEPWIYEPHDFVVVELNSYLTVGEKYNLHMEFQGPLEADLRGYYWMSYTTKAGEEKFLASTFFDPVDARKAFPCFDEPDLKATFSIILEHQPRYHALANMPKSLPDKVLEDGWVRATFEKSVIMSTYLVCYVVSEFVSVNMTTEHGVSFAVWTQEDFIDQADYALQVGADILDHYDHLYGMDIKYPLPKMDMIALLDFTAGAMENWGLITYRESALLYKDGVSSESQKQRVCTIVAHELAHQWFGNLVTMKWWDYIWLNEGFASYVEYVGTEQVEPDFEIWDKFVVYDLQRSMATDALITSRPIVIPVSTPSEINSMFDTISYNKGASILRMMRYFLGESTFTKGLKYYLKDRQNNTAENSDLWRNLQRAVKEDNVDFGSGLTVETIMRTWTRQMGFPTVTVTRLYGGEANKIKAMATQKRFLTDPASDTGSSAYPDLGYKWYVPLTYTTGQNPDFDTPSAMWLLTTENANIETAGDDSDWLLVNTNERGFYRVNYDETNWKLLSRQLMNNHTMISTTSRSALISDAFSLARAGDLSQAKALDLTSYLREERDYVPWYTVDSVLGYIYDNLALTAANASYETYMRAQIEPMYQYVGWANTGNHLQKLSRARAINMACGYGLEDCRTEASTRYADWMTDMITNKVEADLQYIVFCTGIADGGETEWQFAFDLYTNGNTDTSLKSNLQSAMACSKDINILSRYLAAVLNTSQIREQDGKDVVVAVASNPAGTNLAWDFFRNNWAYFRKAYGNTVFLFDSLIKGVTTHFNTLESLKEVEQFMEAHPDQGTGAWAFIQSVAEIKANIRWMEENFVEVTEWLDNASKEPWERIRLPDAILPISYDLKVRTDLTNFAFNGSVDILIECFEKTDVILVHNRNLTIPDGTTTLTREDGGTAPGYKVEPWLYAETEFIVIQLDALLEVGAKYHLHIEFNNVLRNDLGGYYLSSYNPKSGGTRYLASTFFDPVDARKAFPCFDEPDMKATFNITLEYEPQYHALANMPMKGSPETLDGGWMRATFEESVIMSTYLVCYIVSDFKAKFMTTQNDVEFGVWAQEDFINQTDYALQRGVEILDYFDGLYGLEIKYPLTKLDMIALPDFSAGAMENWGLITYREARLLYEEGVSSESRKQSVCTVIAHELAHQWFGNLVTTKWWDYLWLNEGFASWVEYIGTHQVEGDDWAMWDKFVIYDLNRAMGVDALTTSRPIVAKTLTTSEINEMFDTITYNKGASVLRMANDFIGEDTFLKGLKSYLRGLQYRGAENSDLWYHVNKAMMEDGVDLGDGISDIATVMDTWTNQMGFPVVMVTRTYSGETNKITASATQKRFLTDPSSDTTSPYPDLGYVWHVPLTYTSGVNPNFANPEIQWMRPEDQITDVILDGAGGDDNWLLVNVNERGFYSVNYDERNWALLSAQLQTNHMAISIASRSALIYDAFNLARAGDLSQTKALDLTSYLDKEQDYVPWYTVDRVMDYIGDNLALEDANEDFIEYMRKKVTPMYNYVGWNDEEDHLKRLSRSRAISMACGYGNTDCINKAKEMYANWMDNTTNTVIEANLQSTVFCTAISEGGQSEWDAAFAAYTDSTTISSLKDVLESAMACSKDKAVLQMYLSKVLDTALIRSQDGQSVVSAVASNPAGRALAWNFFVENWSFFRETYGNGVFLLDNVVTAVTNDFNTQAELDQVKQFMADNPDQGTGSRAFTKAVAVINANIRWMDQNYEEVAKWLRLNA